MDLLKLFRKDKTLPKGVERVFEKMKFEMEGRKLADQAISYRNLGEYQKALLLLREALEKYRYMPAVTLIGTTAMIKGDIDGAIDWFEGNIRSPMKGAEYLLIELYGNLGAIYLYKKEDARQARALFERALTLPKPDDMSDEHYATSLSLIHRDIAVTYLALGEEFLARDFATKRLKFNPDCDSSKRVISMCQITTSKAPVQVKLQKSAFSDQDKVRVLIIGSHIIEQLEFCMRDFPGIELRSEDVNGPDAIKLFDKLMPDVMILDLNLSVLSGFSVTEEIRKRHPEANIIICSTQSDFTYMRRAVLAGARDYLVFPPNGKELFEAIQRLVVRKP